jgi:dTDP-4-amino-4,6-dideoxygalactose transaminase
VGVINSVPFLDLITPHVELEDQLTAVFRTALRAAGFVGGPMVEEFEREFAQFCETRHCVGVGSGTDALRFALIAAGVCEGDTVITVPNTFIATAEAISQAGGRPEFVDIDERTYNMDPVKLQNYLQTRCESDRLGRPISRRTGSKVKAIVPVHLYGQTADMDPILELAETYKLVVVEDACQAHGAEYFSRKAGCWKKAGSMGSAAAFSFYPSKNLGACGEAGAVTTGDEQIARKIRQLRDHGQAGKYCHEVEGYNGRLDAIQAGILHVKLSHLAEWNQQRRTIAKTYRELFALPPAVKLPAESTWVRQVYHLFVIRASNRDQLQVHLAARDIGTGIHYPVPLHLQKAYKRLGFTKGDFPITEELASEILSLPMYPQLEFEQQRYIVEQVLEFTSSTDHSGRAARTLPRSAA